MLTLGPVLIGIGFYLSSRFEQTAVGQALKSVPWLQSFLGVLLPSVLSVLALSFLYKMMPNTRVRWVPALSGALVAGLLFELSKWGFNLYVSQIYYGTTSTKIYGAFALFPVFLLWIFISWLVMLLGAVVAYTVQHLDIHYDAELQRRVPDVEPHRVLSSYVAIRILLLASYRHYRGEAPLRHEDLVRGLKAPERAIQAGVERLVDGGLLLPVKTGEERIWVPARDIGRISFADALAAYEHTTLQPDPRQPSPEARALDDLFCDLRQCRQQVGAEISFRDLVETIRPEDMEALLDSTEEPGTDDVRVDAPKEPPPPVPDTPKRPDSKVLTRAALRDDGQTGADDGQTGADDGHTGTDDGHTGTDDGHTGADEEQAGAKVRQPGPDEEGREP
jgi:membrane protein